MKSGQILHSVKWALKKAKSSAVPLVANIDLPGGLMIAAVIFDGYEWKGDELVPAERKFESLYRHVEVVEVK